MLIGKEYVPELPKQNLMSGIRIDYAVLLNCHCKTREKLLPPAQNKKQVSSKECGVRGNEPRIS